VTRDPFESLRSRNPVPPDTLPDAPLRVAGAIVAGPSSWRRGPAIAVASAAMVLVAGGLWLAWARGPGREVAVPTSPAITAGLGEAVPFLAATDQASTAVVYFLDARTLTLVPVARDLSVLDGRPLPDLRSLTLQILLLGPGAWDAAPLAEPVAAAESLLTTAIPAGTRLLGLEVTDGVALVDLSEEFAASPPAALAQVVFTLTGEFRAVDTVGFLIEGARQVVASRTSGLFTPYLAPATTTAGLDSVDRGWLFSYLPPVMVESPALGSTLALPATITGLTTEIDAEVHLELLDGDGAVLWQDATPATCPGCPAGHFAVEVPAPAAPGPGWATLRAYPSTLDLGSPAQFPVWLAPPPSHEEPDQPETTTSTTGTYTAPWSAEPLAADALPAVARAAWAAADNASECALLFPAHPAALGGDAVLHDRYFGGGWGLAWDLPSGPGRWEPGGEYCTDCGREAFGVAGAGMEPTGDEDAIWANRLQWTYGVDPGSAYSHAGYGYEGVTAGQAGEPLLAYLLIPDQGCLYNVWSYLGEEHLLALIGQLRFVDGMGAP